jgi:hypothetical protein
MKPRLTMPDWVQNVRCTERDDQRGWRQLYYRGTLQGRFHDMADPVYAVNDLTIWALYHPRV